MTDVVTFGESMAALRGSGPLRLGGTMRLSVAGAESNVAIGLARLGHAVHWIGRVGDDELGQLIRRTLRAEAVETTVATDPVRPTGLLLFEPRIADLTRVHYYRAGSAGSVITATDVLDALTPPVRILHVTGITPALSEESGKAVAAATQRAREQGIAVSLDVNYRARLWTRDAAREALCPLVPFVDILFASEDELSLVADDPGGDIARAVGRLLSEGVETIIVKRSAQGATGYTHNDLVATALARKVRAVDVVGAGDAFVAGYLSGLLDGLDLTARLDRAVELGAFAVASYGDWEGLPSRHELALLDADPGSTIR